MTRRSVVSLIATIAIIFLPSRGAFAQETPAAPASAASATAKPTKPKAGAPHKKPGKSTTPDPSGAGEAAKPDSSAAATPPPTAGRTTGKRKPGSKATSPDSTASEPAKPEPAPGAHAPHEVVERESRIEFDERMVRGQTAAGAIYLFQRAPTEFKSIV